MISRPLWIALGWLSMGCAVAGAVLPLIPTTPFLLAASYAFARGSPRLEAWLLAHPQFGPLIANWRRNGSIDARSKALAGLVMVATLAGSWAAGVPVSVLAIQAVVLGLAALFVLTRPSAP